MNDEQTRKQNRHRLGEIRKRDGGTEINGKRKERQIKQIGPRRRERERKI